ncbi:TPA: TolC family protein [Candidatus Galligastranaerophilus faecipullorum]|nr:TolC family protein [Candidatus Galligastranaerophilus faecipullorum]
MFKSKDTVSHAGENYASESDLIDSDIEAAEFFIYDNEDYIAQESDVIEGEKKKWFNFKSRNKKVQKEEEVYIIEPEKKKNRFKKMSKKDIRKEEKKRAKSEQTKKDSSKEAQGMYETKFPEITSKIEYNDMNGEVTLVDCIKLALSNHPAIVSAISNAQIYESRIGQAWANYFPTISAGASYSRNDMLNTMGNNAYMRMMQQRYNMFYVPTITANMLLFDFGKTKANADMARRNYESSRFDAETSIESVIYNVKVAYYNMVFAQAQKIVYEDTVKDYELQLKQADAYYKIGKKAKIDVTTAQYNLGNAKVNLIKAKNTLELAAVELANAVGIPQLENVILKDKLNTKMYDVNFPDLIKTAEESRPSLLSAKKKMDAAELNIRSAKRAFAPDLSAFGSYDHGGRQIDSDYGYQFGVQFNYTSLNLMSLKKQLDEANATYKKYAADYEQAKQNVYLEVKSAYISLLNSHDSLGVAKLALQQAKEQQYQAFRRYQVGLGNAIEFKDAENTYLNAQLSYYSNLLDYNVNAAELERVIGAPIKETNIDL